MKILSSSIRFNKIIFNLIFSHSFFMITLVGNLIIFGFSFAFYFIEAKVNSNVTSLLDAAWWGFSTATTVGYGDIIPVTAEGKVLGIILMLIGTALFATYTALFAQTILEDEFFRFEMKGKKKVSPGDKLTLEELERNKLHIEKQIEELKNSSDTDN